MFPFLPLFIILVVVPISVIIWAAWDGMRTSSSHEKWIEDNGGFRIPEGPAHRVARALCIADGKNPDGIRGSGQGGPAWTDYVQEAKKYLVVYAAISDELSTHPTQDSGMPKAEKGR